MNPHARRRFDDELEWVLERLPPMVHELIEKVPLHVEDHPSAEVMAKTGVRYRDQLCGLYTGIPLSQRSIQHSGTLPDVVTIYREGILEGPGTPAAGFAPAGSGGRSASRSCTSWPITTAWMKTNSASWATAKWEKGDRSNLCEAPFGPFRQIGPVPFFR